ncbi:MAG: FecR domain-containing protein [Candidatus Riflebacteria bacterium]|nr:FecR domain-containing protein [Candidatus Riflebacteria bacterium]
MNCQEFRNHLESLDSPPIPGPLLEHAKTCPDCQALLRADRRVGGSLTVIDRATPTVDLTPRIMAAIAREPVPREGSDSPFERLMQILFPDTLVKKSLALACCVLILAILARETVLRPTPPAAEPVWEMALLAFDPAQVPAPWAAHPAAIALPRGHSVKPGAGSRVVLTLPGRARAEITDGEFAPHAAGFRLLAGHAEVQVEKTSPLTPFTIGTPFAEVAVVGTRFTLDLSDADLQVAVSEGRVRVVQAAGSREVGVGERLTVGPTGFLADPMEFPEVGSGSSVAPLDAPEVGSGSSVAPPTGSTSSPLEEDNPGR